MRASLIIVCLLLTSCASPRHEPDAETRAYERGYRQAVKEQYWIIQNQQRTTSAPNPKTP
jgi:hypothetical protein